MADVAAVLITVQKKAENLHQLEQPGESLMVRYEPMKKALMTTGSTGFQKDACVDGAPWRKPLCLYADSKAVGVKLAARSPGAKTIYR